MPYKEPEEVAVEDIQEEKPDIENKETSALLEKVGTDEKAEPKKEENIKKKPDDKPDEEDDSTQMELNF